MNVSTRFLGASPRALAAALCAALLLLLLLASPRPAAAASGGAALGSATPTASAKARTARAASSSRPRSVSRPRLRLAQRLLAVTASGTNDRSSRAAVRRFQRLRELQSTGIVDPTTYRQIRSAFTLLSVRTLEVATASASTSGGASVAAPAAAAPEAVLPAGTAPLTATERELLDAIAACESGGSATIVSASGLYHGKYQFSRETWRAVGGAGAPSRASELEQDERAAILLRRRGTQPWPVCGKRAARAAAAR